MLAATAAAQGFFTALFALWTLVAGDPKNGTFRCDAQVRTHMSGGWNGAACDVLVRN